VDGPPAAGKTTLADELAAVLRAQGRDVIRASIDDFLFPRAQRYPRGEYSAEGSYFDTHDYDALNRVLLDPLGPGGDRRFQHAVRNGVRIPEDVSTTGFDDAPIARLSSVDLTTVRQDPELIGVAAVEAAGRRIKEQDRKPGGTIVDTSLVLRGSTAPSPARFSSSVDLDHHVTSRERQQPLVMGDPGRKIPLDIPQRMTGKRSGVRPAATPRTGLCSGPLDKRPALAPY
jgi:hypothetical protein